MPRLSTAPRLACAALCALAAASLLGACATAPLPPPPPKGKPGSSRDNPIRVERMSDEVDRLQAERCPGGGRWQMGNQVSDVTGEQGCILDKISASCTTSPEPGVFWFLHCM